jgi:hypothetical protein
MHPNPNTILKYPSIAANMKYLVLSIIFIQFLTTSSKIVAQGCSDAGVCSIHNIKPSDLPDTTRITNNILNAGLTFGMSQYKVLVFTPYVEYTRFLGKSYSITGRFNSGFRLGELDNIISPSDFLLSAGYNFLNHFTVTAGVKIPLNDANKPKNGQPLPMNYQTSLGTFDILLGFGYRIKRFLFTAGYQQSLKQNKNQFLATDYPEGSPENKYYSTRNYHRAADVLIRFSVIAVQTKKIALIAGVLPIYHLGNDTYQEPDDTRVKLTGSQGLTLNINAILQYQISAAQVLELTSGAPVIARKVRPDGLSEFAISLEYKISF